MWVLACVEHRGSFRIVALKAPLERAVLDRAEFLVPSLYKDHVFPLTADAARLKDQIQTRGTKLERIGPHAQSTRRFARSRAVANAVSILLASTIALETSRCLARSATAASYLAMQRRAAAIWLSVSEPYLIRLSWRDTAKGKGFWDLRPDRSNQAIISGYSAAKASTLEALRSAVATRFAWRVSGDDLNVSLPVLLHLKQGRLP
jgi:hypothetical protein